MSIENTPFLRNTLIADAAMGAVAALALVTGAPFLAPLLALPEALLFWAGLALVPYIVLLTMVSRQNPVSRGLLREVVILNGLWVVASFALLFAGLVSPNWLGTTFITSQALAVAIFTILEASALRSGQLRVA